MYDMGLVDVHTYKSLYHIIFNRNEFRYFSPLSNVWKNIVLVLGPYESTDIIEIDLDKEGDAKESKTLEPHASLKSLNTIQVGYMVDFASPSAIY